MSVEAPDAGESAIDPLIGRTIGGKFVIERLLGAGAMGAVYRASQTALDRAVAIKVMHGELARDPMYAARFHREAKAVSRIDHPNLIRVLDYGQEGDGLLYIAMEFLDGRDLFTVIEEEWPLSHERIVDILSQTLSALAEAHAAGVLHRDLKPENIMLLRKKGEDGDAVDTVKVCDFGIAKIAEDAEATPAPGKNPTSARKLTAAGLVVGTPGYMSPEQARSEPCDARSDVYAMGVILYQLLTRRLPFEGVTPLAIVVKALHEPPPPVDSFGPTAAPGLEPVCMKAINKAPADRYETAREMRAALRAAPVLKLQIVIASNDRPSIVNAPTQLELSGPAPSTGARAVPAPTQGSRFWRAGGVFAGVAIAGLALASASHLRSSAREASTVSSVAPPLSSPLAVVTAPSDTAPASPPATAPPSPPPMTPAPAAVVATSPAPATTPAARPAPLHHTKEPVAVAPDPTPPPAPTPIVSVVPPPPDPPPVVAAPAPTPAPAPPPPAAPVTPAPAPATFNLATARVEIGQARTNNAAATAGNVSRAITPFAARFTSCYRTSLGQATSAHEASATLHLESDDEGYVTSAHVNGQVPSDAARCIEALVTHAARIEVDTGTANADVTLTFRPL